MLTGTSETYPLGPLIFIDEASMTDEEFDALIKFLFTEEAPECPA